MTTPMQQMKPKLPAGLRWSDMWKDADGNVVEGDREIPIDAKTKLIAARLRLCPTDGCQVEQWEPYEYEPDGALKELPLKFCPEHGQQLIVVAADGSTTDPVGSARQRLMARVRQVVADRRQRAIDAAQAKVDELRVAAVAVAQEKNADMVKHRPSLYAAGAAIGAGLTAGATEPVAAVVGGGVVATVGAIAAYAGSYWWTTRGEEDLVGRAARQARAIAQRAAVGTAAAGLFAAQAGVLGVDPSTVSGSCLLAYELLSGCALTWAVNRRHWEKLWADRRRLRDLARQKAEAAVVEAEAEVRRLESLPTAPATVQMDESPEAVGLRMAAEWQRISRSSTVPMGFPMGKTWIVPQETREVTAPIDGMTVRIGWEFSIQCEPGALVARAGSMQPPLIAAREWLAAMLERDDPSTVATVDRPGGLPNRGLLILTDGAPLGGIVPWKGPAGIRRGADGTIYGHVGRTIKGDDVEKALFTPGQPGGGGRYGHTGGGKSVGTRLSLLNDLAAGIFPALYDPKNFVDFSEFIGVIPMGCTREHRDVMLQSFYAEMVRRQQHLTQLSGVDRHGRQRPVEGAWRVERDGPPLRSIWEEFHLESKDKEYIDWLTSMVRLQRATAAMVEVATQGGGLADMGDSVLRGLLNSTCMELYRMPDSQARLAGYTGDFPPSQLPRIPGTLLMVAGEGTPAIPMRTAFVTREDVDGSVYDQLFAPDGSPLLQPPKLPAETLEVFEREGLMDLWRLGQGPNGMANLLSSTPGPLKAPSGAVVAGSGKLATPDVLLGIVSSQQGCSRAWIDGHPAWKTATGGGKEPVPSTVSRNAGQLEKTGLLTRGEGGTDYRVTDAGLQRAQAAWAQLSVALQPAQPSAAQVEADAEHAAELQEEGA